MFKFLKISTHVCLWIALMIVSPITKASLITTTFNGVIDSGSLTDVNYNGNFVYDNSSLINTGIEFVNLSSLSFNFLSTAFTLADADEFTTSTADFLDGMFLGVSYSTSNFDPTFALISGSGNGDTAYFSYTPISGEAGFGSLSFTVATVVPIPASVWLFVSALIGFGTLKRRKI